MDKKVQDIKNCADGCSHLKLENDTTDSFDIMVDWVCHHTNLPEPTLIQPQVEWFEEYHVEIPKWCPLRNLKYD